MIDRAKICASHDRENEDKFMKKKKSNLNLVCEHDRAFVSAGQVIIIVVISQPSIKSTASSLFYYFSCKMPTSISLLLT